MSSSAVDDSWLFPKDFVEETRQEKYRVKTIWFLQDLGKSLSFHQVVKSTAAVYLHRFYVFHKFQQHDRFMVALACLFLASKVEERATKVKDIVVAYFNLVKHCDPSAEELDRITKEVIIKERILLNTLNFDLTVAHPYEFVQRKVKELREYFPTDVKDLLSSMYSVVNDSFYTTACLEYTPQMIALAAFYIATVQLSIQPLDVSRGRHAHSAGQSKSWIDLLTGIDHALLREITLELLALYNNSEHMLHDRDRIVKEIVGAQFNTVSTANTPDFTFQSSIVEQAEIGIVEQQSEKYVLGTEVTENKSYFPSSSSTRLLKAVAVLPTSTSKTPTRFCGDYSPAFSMSRDGSESVLSNFTSCNDWETPLHGGSHANCNETPIDFESSTPRFSRERSDSLNDYTFSGYDFKKQRLD